MLRVLRLSMWILTIPVAWSNTINVYKLDVISDLCVFFLNTTLIRVQFLESENLNQKRVDFQFSGNPGSLGHPYGCKPCNKYKPERSGPWFQ